MYCYSMCFSFAYDQSFQVFPGTFFLNVTLINYFEYFAKKYSAPNKRSVTQRRCYIGRSQENTSGPKISRDLENITHNQYQRSSGNIFLISFHCILALQDHAFSPFGNTFKGRTIVLLYNSNTSERAKITQNVFVLFYNSWRQFAQNPIQLQPS